jgi:hypothetical protein
MHQKDELSLWFIVGVQEHVTRRNWRFASVFRGYKEGRHFETFIYFIRQNGEKLLVHNTTNVSALHFNSQKIFRESLLKLFFALFVLSSCFGKN